MLLWLLALIRNYFRRGRRRCCAARQPPGLFAFIEPIFLLPHPVHSPTVFASYSNRDEAHISALRAAKQNSPGLTSGRTRSPVLHIGRFSAMRSKSVPMYSLTRSYMALLVP